MYSTITSNCLDVNNLELVVIAGQTVPYLLAGVAYTSVFTLTGHPVIIVPVSKTQQGLPIAVQIVGQRWGDRALLDFAEKLVEGWEPGKPRPAIDSPSILPLSLEV